jgi:[protein-PII] uridylyltransferase
VRDNVLAAKQRLLEGQRRLQERHTVGGTGVEICAAIAALRDQVILDLLRAILDDLEAADLAEHLTLVAHGGYGRRDVAPYSDVDLMLLHDDRHPAVPALAERLLRDVFDAGLVLGHSVCTPAQAVALALQDAMVCTSLGESRRLAGCESLFQGFQTRLASQVKRRRSLLVAAIDKARTEERLRYGETVFLLEPNLKRSRGGLRDVQLLRWIGFVRYGNPEPRRLAERDLLSAADLEVLERASEFLLRLRNEVHFHAGKPGDVLDRAEQVRIAELCGYPPIKGMLPVEQFMRDYFRHTTGVSHVTGQFLARARSRDRLTRLATAMLGHRVEHLRVGPAGLLATHAAAERMRGSLAEIMHMVDLANLYDVPIAQSTWQWVREEAPHLPRGADAAAREHFLSLLGCPTRLGPLLRDLHEVGLLEHLLPAFAHARGLLQFNQYHKYTVDEHCLRAVEAAADWLHDQGPLGHVYRQIEQKQLLHLALLIHDLGKGLTEDHVQVGAGIAANTARDFRLGGMETETLKFLVAQHQTMSHVAFRRDTSDEHLVLQFAVGVGSPELLKMLFVMTAADFSAVGPGVWDNWKAEILGDLYTRAMDHLAGDISPVTDNEQLGQRRAAVRELLSTELEDPWIAGHLQTLPRSYLISTTPPQIAEDLRLLRRLDGSGVMTEAECLPESGVVLFTVATRESIAPGVFHRLTGALSAAGVEILSAQINTLADGLVIDRFWVTDPDYAELPPPDRLAEIQAGLTQALHLPAGTEPVFRRTWQLDRRPGAKLSTAQTRVNVDNTSSEQCTIVDIFAHDRVGLLYAITRTLFECGLSVWRARIATHLDQVVDVFYVSDHAGHKITDLQRLEAIRGQLLNVVENRSA